MAPCEPPRSMPPWSGRPAPQSCRARGGGGTKRPGRNGFRYRASNLHPAAAVVKHPGRVALDGLPSGATWGRPVVKREGSLGGTCARSAISPCGGRVGGFGDEARVPRDLRRVTLAPRLHAPTHRRPLVNRTTARGDLHPTSNAWRSPASGPSNVPNGRTTWIGSSGRDGGSSPAAAGDRVLADTGRSRDGDGGISAAAEALYADAFVWDAHAGFESRPTTDLRNLWAARSVSGGRGAMRRPVATPRARRRAPAPGAVRSGRSRGARRQLPAGGGAGLGPVTGPGSDSVAGARPHGGGSPR